MSESPEGLTTWLSHEGVPCPICAATDWAVPTTIWHLSNGAGEVEPMLRAICLSCGFLAWFRSGVPEAASE